MKCLSFKILRYFSAQIVCSKMKVICEPFIIKIFYFFILTFCLIMVNVSENMLLSTCININIQVNIYVQ